MFERLGSDNEKRQSPGTEIGSLADLGLGFIDSGLAKPYNATIGLIAPKIDLIDSYNHNSIAAKVGEFGGVVADMVVLSKVTGGVGKSLAGRGLAAAPMSEGLATTLSLGTTGALYGGVFTPGSASERLRNATVGFATFSTMGATAAKLNSFGFLGQAGGRSLAQSMAHGGLSGIPAGLVETEVSSLVNGRGLVLDPTTLGKSALYYGAFGATIGGAGHALANGGSRVSSLLKEGSSVREGSAVRESSASAEVSRPRPAVEAAEGTSAPRSFDIPKRGNVELGRMMREVSPADQSRLVQEVLTKLPDVPLGSWMRLIGKEDMVTFLRTIDKMHPENALKNANYLIETGNLRPPTPQSPPIDFKAWQEAMKTVRSQR